MGHFRRAAGKGAVPVATFGFALNHRLLRWQMALSELLLGLCCGENVHLFRLPRLVAHLEKQVATKRDQGNSEFLPPILHLRTLVIELPGRSPLSCCAWLLPSQVTRKNEIHLGCSNVYDNREGKNLPEGPSRPQLQQLSRNRWPTHLPGNGLQFWPPGLPWPVSDCIMIIFLILGHWMNFYFLTKCEFSCLMLSSLCFSMLLARIVIYSFLGELFLCLVRVLNSHWLLQFFLASV